jgi:hypothetical protein
MGRWSTGTITTREVTRIELGYLLKNGIIKKENHILYGLSWTNGSSIQIEVDYKRLPDYGRSP